MTSRLDLQKLTKSFGSTPVLRGVELSVKDGEFVAIIGPSGCGKSTLLRVIAGLEQQDAGQVCIGGTGVDMLPPKSRDVAMVFQSYALYPHMTVAQNIALPLVMRDLSRAERLPLARWFSPRITAKRARIAEAVAVAAAQVELTQMLERKPGQLSGGQRQRVALARALVRKPRLFLLDEPLSNLDAALRASTRTEIVELQRRLGVTTVYVTHDQAEAMTMADRIAVMIGGEVVQFATAREIYESPADMRVAQFIGTPRMNMMPARAVRNVVHIAGMAEPIGRSATVVDGEVHVGVRPEHVGLVPPGSGELDGVVRTVEFLGSEVLIHVLPRGMTEAIVLRTSPDAAYVRLGEMVGLQFVLHAMHLFDGSGLRHSLVSSAPYAPIAGVQLEAAQ